MLTEVAIRENEYQELHTATADSHPHKWKPHDGNVRRIDPWVGQKMQNDDGQPCKKERDYHKESHDEILIRLNCTPLDVFEL